MNKIFIALLVIGYCFVSNQDFEDAQLAHSHVQVASNAR